MQLALYLTMDAQAAFCLSHGGSLGASGHARRCAAAAAQSSGWMPGPGAVLDNTYDGFIDVPTSGATVPGAGQFLVTGWFVDRTAQGWAGADDVQVFLGAMDGGGTMLAKASFAQSRPDVATALGNPFFVNSGFSAVINGASVPAGQSDAVGLRAHAGQGLVVQAGQRCRRRFGTGTVAPAPGPVAPVAGAPPELTVLDPKEEQEVSTQVGIHDHRHGQRSRRWRARNRSRRDLHQRRARYRRVLGQANIESDGSWSLTFKPTNYASQHSNLYVYAHSRNTGKETQVIRGFNIIDR